MTEKKGVGAQGRPRYEPPRVVRLGASAKGRGNGCGPGKVERFVSFFEEGNGNF